MLNKNESKLGKYLYDSLQGKDVQKPQMREDKYSQFVDAVINSEKRVGTVSKELLQIISEISSFDVGLSNISDNLAKLSDNLADRSQTNLAAVEETIASMNIVNDSVSMATEVLNSLAEESGKLVSRNYEGMEQLKNISKLKDEAVADSNDMSSRIDYLIELVNGIEQMLESVAVIANKTNLLALNASIEAARAGEHGRGFAVVAEEVRELADGTQNQLKDMKEFVKKIYEASEAGKESTMRAVAATDAIGSELDSVTQTVSENVALLDEVVNQMQDVNIQMSNIRDAVTEVHDAMESSSGSAEDISDMSISVSELATESKKYGAQISSIDESISNNVKMIYMGLNEGIAFLSNDEFIETLEKAKEAHIGWLTRLKSMVDNMNILPLQFNPSRCAFGHFYHVIDVENKELADLWTEIGNLHGSFHLTGKKIAEDIENNNKSEAMNKYRQVDEMSKEMLSLLQKSIDIIKDMNKRGVSVF